MQMLSYDDAAPGQSTEAHMLALNSIAAQRSLRLASAGDGWHKVVGATSYLFRVTSAQIGRGVATAASAALAPRYLRQAMRPDKNELLFTSVSPAYYAACAPMAPQGGAWGDLFICLRLAVWHCAGKERSVPGTGSTSSVSITISTPRGPVRGQWRPASVTRAAAILLPDAPGALGDPFHLFDELAVRIQRSGASVLQLEQSADSFDGRLVCLLSALTALRRQGVQRMALIGWHSGAALAIAAGSASETVTGVAALAPDTSCADFVAEVAPRRLLLMHGSADNVVPAVASRLLYAHAADPKELVIFPGESHDFSVFHQEALDKLTVWTRTLLRSPFKPRKLRRDTGDAYAEHPGAPSAQDAKVALPSAL